MKIVFLGGTEDDLAWMRKYYQSVFPDGRRNAVRHYRAALKLLHANPMIGHAMEGTSIRRLIIPRTPFAFYYRIRNDQIQVVRVFDQRSEPLPRSSRA